MAFFQRNEITIHYEESGAGYPLLLFAPGGMKSAIGFWDKAPFNPIREFAADFRVIAMDQRNADPRYAAQGNAGSSRAPLGPSDGWHSYTGDHLALLDYLGIKRCHLMGGCIGSSYCLSLIARAPERVTAAVLQNPVGLSGDNRELFYKMFEEWAAKLDTALRDESAALRGLKHNMFGGEFVFSVSRDQVRKMDLPLLILAGNDPFHPPDISQELAGLAPNATLVLEWKAPEIVSATVQRVKAFLKENTPKD